MRNPVLSLRRHAACASRCAGLAAVLAVSCGCAQPIVFKTLDGGSLIYPDLLGSKPTILAFLSANDRRNDKEIPSLWALTKRPGTPAQIVGVLDYADFSFVQQIQTLDHATFPILLDPEHKLIRKYGVDDFPTYVFVAWDGDEVDRARTLKDVPQWLDDPAWYRKALPPPESMKPAE